jgi:chromosome segregation ATPase
MVAVINRATNRDSNLQRQFDEYTKNLRADIATSKADIAGLQARVRTLEQDLLTAEKERIKVEQERDAANLQVQHWKLKFETQAVELQHAKAKIAALARRITQARQGSTEAELVTEFLSGESVSEDLLSPTDGPTE